MAWAFMPAIQMVIGLLVVVVLIAWLAAKLKLPYPILLVIGGLALSLVDGLPRAVLAPEVISLLLLPPLVFYAALLTSWRDFKSNAKPITLLALGLVIATSLCVAVVCKWFVPGFTWPAAFVIGAILSPTDTIAAVAVAKWLKVPKRVVTILEGESMMNDAAALVAYRLAVAAVVTGAFSAPRAGVSLLIVSVGGIVVGLLAGLLIAWIAPRVKDVTAETAGSLLAPYVAYLAADAFGFSTVLALCAAGLLLSRRLPTVCTGPTRLRIFAAWDTFVFLLNGLAFILIGLNLPVILETLAPRYSNGRLVAYATLVAAVTIGVRMGGVFFIEWATRVATGLATRRPQTRQPTKVTFVVAWTGMRGVVSLAAALALPTVARGEPFPARDLIIFLTFCVILATLVLQGLSLPFIIRRLGLDVGVAADDHEELVARHAAALAAVERLTVLEGEGALPPHVLDRTRAAYDDRVQFLVRQIIDGAGDACTLYDSRDHLARDLLGAEREAIILLRDRDMIGDETLRRLQAELDLEESRLCG